MINELIEGLKQKRPQAQKAFYEKYSLRLYKLCFRYVNNQQDASAILNAGFYQVFKNFEKFIFIEERSLMVWMQKIMINESLKFLRRNLNYTQITNQAENELESQDFPDCNLKAEDYYQMICKLDEGYRTVFNLYAIEGFSHAEIASALNISESTSRSQLARARTKLKEMIQNW